PEKTKGRARVPARPIARFVTLTGFQARQSRNSREYSLRVTLLVVRGFPAFPAFSLCFLSASCPISFADRASKSSPSLHFAPQTWRASYSVFPRGTSKHPDAALAPAFVGLQTALELLSSARQLT